MLIYRRSSVPTVILALAAATSLAACAEFTETDRMLFEIEREQPLLGLMRRHEPEAYDGFRKTVEQALKDRFNNVRALSYEASASFAELLQKRVMTAPDENVSELLKMLSAQAEELEGQSHLCRIGLTGGAGEGREHLSAELKERQMEVLGELLAAPDDQQGEVASPEETEKTLRSIVSRGASSLGMTDLEFEGAVNGGARREDVCRASSFMLRSMADLPEEEAAAVFRQITRMQTNARYGEPY